MEVKAERRKKEVCCGNHRYVAWGKAGSSYNGKEKRKFLFEQPTEGSQGHTKMKQILIIQLTENEMITRNYLVSLADRIEEERDGKWSLMKGQSARS